MKARLNLATAPVEGNRRFAVGAATAAVVAARNRLRDPVFIGLGALVVACLALVAALVATRKGAPVLPPIQFIVTTLDSTKPVASFPWPAAISPDGGTVVYSVAQKTASLYALRTGELVPRPVLGTANAYQPYFSPDGRWLAFEMGSKEWKARLDGSAPVAITDAGGANGGTWTTGNEIVLGSQGTFTGLSRVSAAGGTAVALTRPDTAKGERNHLWPLATPDGKAIVFVIWKGSLANAQLAVASLGDGKYAGLGIEGIRPLAVLDGMLVYVKADGSVMAVRLDVAGKRVRGVPIPVHDPIAVVSGLNGNSEIYVSQGGAMVTSVGGSSGRLAWLTRAGHATVITPAPAEYALARLSPDERRIAVLMNENRQSDVWIYDLGGGTMSRLTTVGTVTSVDWTPDGSRVVYTAAVQGGNDAFLQVASGGVPPERLGEVPYAMVGATMASNGKSLLFDVSPQSFWQLAWASRDSSQVIHTYLAAAANFHAATFSPDGKWVALVSDESGQDEVYVRSFPDPSVKMQISAAGGEEPTWSRDGHRLYYVTGTTLLAARITTAPALTLAGRDTVLPNLQQPAFADVYFYAGYQVSRDASRFLTALPDQNDYRLVVAPNWITELRRKVAEAGGQK